MYTIKTNEYSYTKTLSALTILVIAIFYTFDCGCLHCSLVNQPQ